ncbi:MAG: SMI1/KNR4 family protein [Chloroflexota bacterium]
MQEDFPEFLTKNKSGFLRQDDGQQSPVFVSSGNITTDADIKRVEQELDVSLPQSYRQFLLICGSGAWCDDWIPSPNELYAFDENCWEMAGFVTLVHNVEKLGDFLAINPTDLVEDGERPIYYCSHDPFGYAQIAISFEEWCRNILAGKLTGTFNIYDDVEDAVYAKWKEYRASQPKKWWHVWR